MTLIRMQDCRRVSLEEAVEILYHNPSCFVERYNFETKTITRLRGLFKKDGCSDYMDQVYIDDDKPDAEGLLSMLYKEELYTQTDEFLSVVTKNVE